MPDVARETSLRHRPARAGSARRRWTLAARSGRAQRRQRADARPGRARRDEPDARDRGADRRRPRAVGSRSCCASTRAARSRRARRASAAAAARARRTATRSSRRRCRASAPSLSRHMLAPGARDRRARRPADARAGRRETALVERGAVVLVVDGERHALGAGDCVTFDADLPHHFENTRPARRRSCWPSCPPGCAARRADDATDAVRQDLGRPRGRRRACIYIDLHLVHEVTSAAGVRRPAPAGRTVRRPDRTLATADHNVPDRRHADRRADPRPALARAGRDARAQLRRVRRARSTASAPSARASSTSSDRSSGVTQPGMTIVCGDSHTATHGAFGALAFGIGTSEVEHVLATQTLVQRKPKTMRDPLRGRARPGVTAKDLILGTIGQIGVGGGTGHVVEFAGAADRGALDGGPHDGLQHVDRGRRPRRHDRARRDDVRLARGRPARRPTGRRVGAGASCAPTTARRFDTRSSSTPPRISPKVTWGTTPAMVVGGRPTPCPQPQRPRATSARCATWASRPGTPIEDIALDRVFIGSCTNSRIGDLRAAAGGRQGPQGRRRRPRDGRARAPSWSRRRPRPRASTRSSRPPASNGATRAARCASGMNPDIARARRALRLDLQPQLRGPPGPRRPHAPRQPADGRCRGDRRPLRRHQELGAERWSRSRRSAASSSRARPRRRRHRPDHPQAVPQAGRAHRLRRVPVLRLGQGARLRPADAEPDPGRRAQLRLRLEREHAPWALEDYGFQAVIAPCFADIFRTNCTKIGLLPVELPEDEVRALIAEAGEAEVDLDGPGGRASPGRARAPSSIDPEIKQRLLNGLDDIALTLAAGGRDRRLRGATASAAARSRRRC